jgi:hypothetical protein
MISRILSLLCLSALCITFVHCGGSDPDPDPEPTEQEIVTEMLVSDGASWAPSGSTGITVDGVDVTETLFQGFSIKFGENTFTTTGTSPVWEANDTWAFKGESSTVIIRGSDDEEITITNISESELVLTLEWDSLTTLPPGGRAKSIPGTHKFTLTK